MPRRAAKVTQADIARAIRAARETGADAVMVDSDGVIHIALKPNATPVEPRKDFNEAWAPSEALQRYLTRSESG
jgi:hypothetical protein